MKAEQFLSYSFRHLHTFTSHQLSESIHKTLSKKRIDRVPLISNYP